VSKESNQLLPGFGFLELNLPALSMYNVGNIFTTTIFT